MDSNRIEALDTLMRERRSVRGFLPHAAPDALLRTIFETAQLAPSNCNVQPWVVHVVSGASAARMRTALHSASLAAEPLTPDIPLTGTYPGAYRSRQVNAAKALFSATGVAREDTAARLLSYQRNFQFFDAPHAAFIFMPDWAGMREAADCGMFVQSLMLALTAHGLASCAQGSLSHHAAITREVLGVGPELKLLFGLAFGYEDPEHPANATRTLRAPLDETTCFHP
jgi:nitroreductase